MEAAKKRGRPRRVDGRENKNRVEEVYRFITGYAQEHHGRTPTLREIGNATGISSTSLTSHYVDKLVEQKRLGREAGTRGIWVV